MKPLDLYIEDLKKRTEESGSIDPFDFETLAYLNDGGKFNYEGKDYNFFDDNKDGPTWEDPILEAYANYIYNYVYEYKPEAQAMDPTDDGLDPSVTHIGPIAQDIEKVNPACVKETEDGVKTVDTARLSMMNAGAIAQLAREIRELKEVLNG
jgi:hypothetical protein